MEFFLLDDNYLRDQLIHPNFWILLLWINPMTTSGKYWSFRELANFCSYTILNHLL